MKTMKRLHVCILFIVISSCSTVSEGWKCGKIDSSTEFSCSHLTLPSKNLYRNLEIHFQKDQGEIKIYLNAFATPFEKNNNDSIEIVLIIENQQSVFEAYVLEGSQRLLLPSPAKDLLLNALNEKKDITIVCGRYSVDVHYDSYEQEFNKFNTL